MPQPLINANPVIYATSKTPRRELSMGEEIEDVADPIDAEEIFGMTTPSINPLSNVQLHSLLTILFSCSLVPDLIRSISDPEHPLTLEQLNVTQCEHITVDDAASRVRVEFTPTIPHCSMATLIGLCIRVRLLRSLPDRFKVCHCFCTHDLAHPTLIYYI